jgi:phage repressor protein C with HTH and peptisase S24 domain
MLDLPSPEAPEAIARRLVAARARRYATASDAARALGVKIPTYLGHENGARDLTRAAPRYARFFSVSLDWLLRGHGTMSGVPVVPILGRVGAGSVVTDADDAAEIAAGDWVEMPREADAQAFVVEGDSMRPRFLPGEVLVFERDPSRERNLVGQYCLVQIKSEAAERYVKILRHGRGEDRWRLDSHNADPIEDVELFAAWRWLALLPPRTGAPVVPESKRRPRRR